MKKWASEGIRMRRTRITYPGAGLSRRAMIGAGLGVLVSVVATPRGVLGQVGFRQYPFSLGVASGEPLSDGVVLWTRIAPEPLQGGGMPMEPVSVRWELADDDGMRRVIQRGETVARPELAHAVHVEVSGLDPAREYWYRFYVGGEASQIGRTKTAPSENAPLDRLRFGVSGCQNYEAGYYTAYRHLAEEQFDFVFHYGDYIYENRARTSDDPQRVVARELPVLTDEPYSLDDYRNRYAAYKTDPDLQAAHRSAPFLMSFDDHEVENNWAGEHDQDGTPPAYFLLRRASAFQAYYEHMPLRISSLPQGARMSMYRRFRYGTLAEVNVLDTRQYRTDQPCGGGRQANCTDALDPRLTMLGADQERWLFDGLRRSNARWNVLAQQVPMMRFDLSPDENVVLPNMDKWDGAVAARQRLFDVLQQNQVANPIVLAGDVHSNWAAELKSNFEDDNSATVGCEFVSTSITSRGDGADQRTEAPQILAQNPYMKFHNDQRGYLSMEVTPDLWQTHFRIVDYVSRPGAPLRTRASFVVEGGVQALHRG